MLWLAAVAGADTYPRQPGIDALHYVFRVVVKDGSNEIAGETTVTLKAVADGVRSIELDLTSAASGKGMTVSAVTQQTAGASSALAFTHLSDRLRVTLPAAVSTGTEVSLTVTYAGVPGEGLRLIDNIHGERVVFSENWPNRRGNGCRRSTTRTTRRPASSSSPRRRSTRSWPTGCSSRSVTWPTLVASRIGGSPCRLPRGSTRWESHDSRSHHAGVVKGVELQTWSFPQDRDTSLRIFEDLSRRAMTFSWSRSDPTPTRRSRTCRRPG